jgi:hypothetical protein
MNVSRATRPVAMAKRTSLDRPMTASLLFAKDEPLRLLGFPPLFILISHR